MSFLSIYLFIYARVCSLLSMCACLPRKLALKISSKHSILQTSSTPLEVVLLRYRYVWNHTKMHLSECNIEFWHTLYVSIPTVLSWSALRCFQISQGIFVHICMPHTHTLSLFHSHTHLAPSHTHKHLCLVRTPARTRAHTQTLILVKLQHWTLTTYTGYNC